MTDVVWQKPSILAFTFMFALGGCDNVPPSIPTDDLPSASEQSPVPDKPPIPDDPIQIHVVAPNDYISGGVFKLQAVYEVDGEFTYVDVDDRLLYSDASFIVQLPRREQGVLKEIRAALRHPKYKPAIEVIAGGEGLTPPAITVRPMRWTTNERNTWIKPTYETLVAGMEHLRWIRTTYLQRPERLAVNEAFQKDHRLVALLAYGGGGKKGEWEELRQATIAEWEAIAKVMEERSHEPCPPGYVLETLTNRPCGALVFNAANPYADAHASRADETDESRVQDLVVEAEIGNAAAQYELGVAYESGLGVERDQGKALEYFYLAANHGHAAAQNEIGNSFHGQGRFIEAVPWYEKSSDGGDLWGIHNLAYLHEQGRGVPPNEEKAISLYLRAAELGNADSMWNMAVLYANGREIPKDIYAACVWTHRALTGFDNGRELDDREERVLRQVRDTIMLLAYELTKDEMASCKTEANSWRPVVTERSK